MSDPVAHLQAVLAGRYRFEQKLGRGGMATVFLAQDLKHQRPVAVKVLHPEISAALGPERFLREIRIAASLNHPHILTLIDSGEVPAGDASPRGAPLLYYTMPYVEGESLRDRLNREGRLPPGDAVRIMQDVLDALAYAHRQGIVHRDIKPENIMLTGRHALVVDFGVAKAASDAAGGLGGSEALTSIGLAIGTPAYMAPEQAAGDAAIDGRTDLYAVGELGYEMLTGQPPFTGPTPLAAVAAHLTESPTPMSVLRAGLPEPLATATMRCLERDPADRWESAEALLQVLDSFSTPAAGTAATRLPRRRSRRALIGLAVFAAVAGAWIWTGPLSRARGQDWAHRQAIPRLLALAESGDWEKAYALAKEVDRRVPGDSLFNALLPRFAQRYRVHTVPEGAEVWRKPYGAPDSAWELLGRTPLDSALVALSGPGGRTYDANRIRIRAPGYRTLELVGLPFADSVITLDRDGAIPPEMVRVGGGRLSPQYAGFENDEPITLADFLMDRFEVANREYQRFVDSGGYRRPEFWTEPFEKDGAKISWQAAMALMTDRTGRTGPSTWEAGEYPRGKEDDPVGGVSWYEAMAYARFAGKSLPTLLHWSRAASLRNSALVVPRGNFAGQGTVPAGSTGAMSAFGTYDMAGNLREWVQNANGGDRYILGGGWADPPFRFNDAYAQVPFDRSALNGIRLVSYDSSDANLARAAAPVERRLRDFVRATPVSDAVFAAYREAYAYDRKPLNAQVLEKVDEGSWTRELVRLDAAYGDSLLAYLFLPKQGTRPFPAVVFFPPGISFVLPGLPADETRHFDFLLKSGRAVLYPIYKGTFQRRDSLRSYVANGSIAYRDHVVMWAKDLGRAIDYLETRPEISTGRLAYYGVSWGGAMGGLMPAIEPRIKLCVLQVAGLQFTPVRPEVDPVNYLPRIHVPTLMINGRWDFYFPIETSQIPMFRLLGTPPDQKRHVIEEGSHFVPRVRLIQETLAWLDRYQPSGK